MIRCCPQTNTAVNFINSTVVSCTGLQWPLCETDLKWAVQSDQKVKWFSGPDLSVPALNSHNYFCLDGEQFIDCTQGTLTSPENSPITWTDHIKSRKMCSCFYLIIQSFLELGLGNGSRCLCGYRKGLEGRRNKSLTGRGNTFCANWNTPPLSKPLSGQHRDSCPQTGRMWDQALKHYFQAENVWLETS